MQDLSDTVVAITGANIGIGRAVAEALARRGAKLRLLCRNPDKAEAVAGELRAHTEVVTIACDLGRLASVRAAAQVLLARDEPLHVLVNNAGVAGQRGQTSDGFELAFGTNHLGHFLLTQLLLDRLRASAPARIVHVASNNHYRARGIDWEAVTRPTSSVSGLPEYDVSKLANVTFAVELARRLTGTGVTSYAVNPGRVASNIWQRIPWPVRPLFKLTMRSTARGAESTLLAATGTVENGGYYDQDAKRRAPNPLANDLVLARELWQHSEALLERAPA
ncbi:MAG: SDR family NAD(P)-dependent oxidoreductase [Kofleriaceae bacterium]